MGNLIKIVLLVGLAYWGYTQWNKPSGLSEGPYTEVSMPTDLKPHHVMVVAAENCTKAAAQHADFITRSLKAENIPVQRVHRVSFNISSREDAKKIEAVMNAGPPVVFYNGKAQANPTWEEVQTLLKSDAAQE